MTMIAKQYKLYRVKEEFSMGSIYYPVGVTRLYTTLDVEGFLKSIENHFSLTPDGADAFFETKFEAVGVIDIVRNFVNDNVYHENILLRIP